MKKLIGLIVLSLLAFCVCAYADWTDTGAWKGGEKRRSVAMQIDDAETATAIGDNRAAFNIPYWLNGAVLERAEARVFTPGSGAGTLDVSVEKRTTTSDAVMYSTTVKTSYTSASGTVTAANTKVATGDLVKVDVTRVHGTPAKGLWVVLTFLWR